MPVKNIIPGQTVTKEKLQRARELRRDMTPAEKILWQELRANKLGVHFRRQQVIAGFIVDFTVTMWRWSLKWMVTSMIYSRKKMLGGREF
jgi:very-short-patch-repair endonuclease